jgi:ABC-type Fe2+-enterobactin transport system substrate-binding protein
MKRIAAVLTLAGAIAGVVAPVAASAATTPQVCVHVHGSINGTPIDNDTCVPQ